MPNAESLDRVENEVMIERLRESAEPASSEYRLGGWELLTHPDLCDRLDEVAPGGHTVELYGRPGRASARGVLYAVAVGLDRMLLRLSDGPARDAVLANGGSPAPDYGPDWVTADAWLSDVPRQAGTALLVTWLDAAREAADA